VGEAVSTTVVAYWAGNLPEITALHFISFERQNDLNFKYILYADNSQGFESSIPPSLAWLKQKPWFEIRNVELSQLMTEFDIQPFSKWKPNLRYRFLRKLKTKALHYLLLKTRALKMDFLSKYVSTHWNEEVGFTFSHNQKFSGLANHLTYRADIFRSIIANEFPNENVLYVDLDICFTKVFSKYDWSKAFTSPWGRADFANTAIIYFPISQRDIRTKILGELRSTSAAWPWTLYSQNRCSYYGLELRLIEEFDPPWASDSPVSGDSSAFMQKRMNSQEVVDWTDEKSFCFHWHNQWQIIPESGSPYDLYLKKFTA